jgi:general secretion pathway protein C
MRPLLRIGPAVALLAALLVLGCVAAVLADRWSSSPAAGPPAAPRGLATPTQEAKTAAPIEPVARREAAVSAPAPLPARLRLVALDQAARGRVVAVIAVQGAAPGRFGVGDHVAPGVRLVRVMPDGVQLQRGLAIEHLALPPGAPRLASPGVAAPAEPAPVQRSPDLAAPSSTAVDRAVQRARQPG